MNPFTYIKTLFKKPEQKTIWTLLEELRLHDCLPCPFCGHDDYVELHRNYGAFVYCQYCGARGTTADPMPTYRIPLSLRLRLREPIVDRAIKEWNRRERPQDGVKNYSNYKIT